MAKKKNLVKEKHNDSDRVLSQDEIDRLLVRLANDEEKLVPDERKRKIKIFDFYRPDIIGKEQMRGLKSILEEFCTAVTKYFKNELEIFVCVRVASVDLLTREEFIRSIPTLTFALSTNWLGGVLSL